MVLEVEADHLGVGRHGVDALLAAGAEQLQRRRHVHLRIVEFRRRRRVHHIAALDLHRIGVGRGDAAVAGDVLVELHMHQAVFLERMHLARLGLARLEEAQRLGDRHLVDQHLAGARAAASGMRWRVWMIVASPVSRGHRDIGDLLEEGADRDGVGGVVGALVDDLQHVVRADDRGRHLHAAGAPAIGHRHFAAGERHLVAGDGDRLEDRAADHPLGLLVEIGEVVGWRDGGSFGRLLRCLRCRLRGGFVLGAHAADEVELGLEVDIVRQLQVLDEAGRLDIVGMRDDEFLVLRRRRRRPRRARSARSARSHSAIAIALRSAWPKTRP